MSYILRYALLVSFIHIYVYSECPNGCSGHGKCGIHNFCTCQYKWTANDCSQRACQFSNAYVDSPKGDLDDSGDVTGPDKHVVRGHQLNVYGFQEQYPNMVDSDLNILSNTAHEYRECSNKGVCDREQGTCMCFEGYEGSACQRFACPRNQTTDLECNGHGTCQSARAIAAADYDNQYVLWDKDISQNCVCDPGYYGANCGGKMCKIGFDPLYYTEENSRRYSNWSYTITTTSSTASLKGNYSIYFYDYKGRKWSAGPIDANADCKTVTQSLEKLPNNIITPGSVRCLKVGNINNLTRIDDPALPSPNVHYGIKYILSFPSTPGKLRQLDFNIHLDGDRPTLYSDEASAPIHIAAYPDGFQGENYEYFSEMCVGVDATILTQEPTEDNNNSTYQYLSGLTPLEFRLLQRCLGDADGYLDESDDTVRVLGKYFDWDHGSKYNPHLIRMVDQTVEPITDLCLGVNNSERWGDVTCKYSEEPNGATGSVVRQPSGFIVPLYFDITDSRFKLLTRPGMDYSELTTFEIFTTTGFAQMASESVTVHTFDDALHGQIIYTTNSSEVGDGNTGSINCESNSLWEAEQGLLQCVEKENVVFIVDPYLTITSMESNPKYLNLHIVKRLWEQPRHSVDMPEETRNRITLDQGMNTAYRAEVLDQARLYVFTPPLAPHHGYRVTSECSNRGNCDTYSGLCNCFDGYRGDACQIIDSSAHGLIEEEEEDEEEEEEINLRIQY